MAFWENQDLAPWVAAVVPAIHESRQPGHPKIAVLGHTVAVTVDPSL
jgi:hypothetical protein